MATRSLPKTIAAERVTGGVIITFNTGEEGFYSDQLLYGSLPKAQQLLSETLEQNDAELPPFDKMTPGIDERSG